MSKTKEIVINADSQVTRIAIVESGELAELFIETDEHERTIGNLFLGKVRRVMPSIQAAFVDIGQKQDAFLHFSDLGEALPDWLEFVGQDKPEIARFAPGHVHKNKGRRRRPVRALPRKRLEDGAEDPEVELAEEQDGSRKSVVGSRDRGRRKKEQKPTGGSRRSGRSGRRREESQSDDGVPPESFLKRDQPILVKISKEPIAQKGSRVTTDISLAGRFVVLVPMANYVAVSKKISSFKERRRLRALAKMLLPDGFGVIVRTVAEGQNAKALDTDLRLLKEKWQSIEKRLGEAPKPPAPVYQDVNMVSSIMRDLFSEDYDRILIDDNSTYRNIKGYVQAVAPDIAPKVKLHERKEPVFRTVGIERAINEAFESRVNLPSGGYLYIEQTEAMHVIDVNSGRAGRGLSQEENSLKVNLEAAKVISKQIRLRDLGGILVIDFIDMRSERSRRKVYDQIRREFRKDRAVTKVLPMSDFGLMQITRQRLRPSITTTFGDIHEDGEPMEPTPTSAVEPRERVRPRTVEPTEVVDRIEEWLGAFGRARWKGAIRFRVHPFTAAYLSRGVVGFRTRCLLRYRLRIRLEENAGMDPGRFRCYDETNGKEIRRPPRRGLKKEGRAGREADPDSRKSADSGTGDSSRRADNRRDDSSASRDSDNKGSRRGKHDSDARADDSSKASGRGQSGRGKADSRGRGRADSEAPESAEKPRSTSRGGRSGRQKSEPGDERGAGRGKSGASRSRASANDAAGKARGRSKSREDGPAEEEAPKAPRASKAPAAKKGGRGSTRSSRSEKGTDKASPAAAALTEGAEAPVADMGDAPAARESVATPMPALTPDGAPGASAASASEEAPPAEGPEGIAPAAEASTPEAPATETSEPRAEVGTRKAPRRAKAPAADASATDASEPEAAPSGQAPPPDHATEQSGEAPGITPEAADAPAHKETVAVRPHKLRYSSSHRSEPEPSPASDT